MHAFDTGCDTLFFNETVEGSNSNSAEYLALREVLSFAFGFKADAISHFLLETLGSSGRVLFGKLENASGNNVQPDVAAFLTAIRSLVECALESRLRDAPILSDSPALRSYLLAKSAFYQAENFRVLYLSATNELLADDLQAVGSIDKVTPVPRQIIHRALDLGAAGMVLVHNHPSGDLRPSHADIEMTRRIFKLAGPLDIQVLDHIIVTRDGLGSMREDGFL